MYCNKCFVLIDPLKEGKYPNWTCAIGNREEKVTVYVGDRNINRTGHIFYKYSCNICKASAVHTRCPTLSC